MSELLILGSGTGVPNADRGTPGYLLNVGTKSILLDTGSGTLQRLIRYGVTYQDIDYILYSHLHPDHTLDLVSMLFAARNPRNLRKKDLVLIGPDGLKDFYEKLLLLYGKTILPESYKITFKEMSDGSFNLDDFEITAKTLDHTDESIGFRIELKKGGSLAYSGDTDYCENILLLAKEADLLVLESSFPDEFRVKGHLTPSLAGRIASEALCRKLVLTHLYPICDRYPILKQCRRHFKGEVILARDGMRLKLKEG